MSTTYPVCSNHQPFRYCLLVIITCLVYNTHVFGQVELLKSVIPPSPNVASLGKYGDIPVSLYTGIPNISIPLYEITDGDLRLPISLSYHAAGVRVEEVPSNVGLGWTLNAGGVIGRSVRGQPDDVGPWQPQPPERRIETIMFSNDFNQIKQLIEEVQWYSRDGEADLYYYNFEGYSGKFFYDQTGTAHTLPLKNLAIQPYLAGWRVISENGTVYTFEKSEYVSSAACSNDNSVFNAWYLTSIKSSDGKREITFTYTPVMYTYTTLSGQIKYYSINGTGGACLASPGMCLGTQHYNTHRLSRIDFGSGYCLFNYYNVRADLVDDKSLDEILVYNKNNELKKKFSFAYSYFGDNSDGPSRLTENNKRLKLLSVTEESPGIPKPPYQFYYNESIQLPHRQSYAQDHWGYFNGATNNPGLIATFTTLLQTAQPVTFYEANREASASTAQAAILNRIKYPTGGETIFTYESNKISDNKEVTEVITRSVYLGASTQAMNLPNPYDSPPDLVIPPGGAMVKFYVSGLGTTLWAGCDIVQCQVIKDNNPTPYRTLDNLLHGVSEMWPQGTYKLRLVKECGIDSWASFSVTAEASIPETTYLDTRVVGGLRIKQIEDRPGHGQPPIIKKYRYTRETDTTKSSAVLVNFPDYGYDLGVQSWTTAENGSPYPATVCVYRVRQSFSNYPLATTQGSYVGYSHVIEDLGENGENHYRFEAYTNFVGSGFPFAPVESFDWRRGFQRGVKNYKRKNGALVLAREVINTPAEFGEFRLYGIKTGQPTLYIKNGASPPGIQPLPAYTFYPTSTMFFGPGKTVERIYDQDDASKYIEQTTTYTYHPQHLQVSETGKVTSHSDATVKEEMITKMKYPFDYSFSGTPSGTEASSIKKLQDLHVANAVIEEYVTKQSRNTTNNQVFNQRVTGGKITTFKSDNPYPHQLFRLDIKSPVSLSDFGNGSVISGNAFVKNTNATIANAYKPLVSFVNYDEVGNITTQQKTSDVPHAYLWGYNKRYPIAQAVNAAVKDIFHTSFEDADGNSADGDARTGRKSRTGGYIRSLSNLTNGAYILSWWQKSGTAWTLQTSTVQVSNAAYTINLSGQVDEVRFYPAGAQMNTYTYEPLMGITSQCDPANHITYYEYDSAGRLKALRDQKNNILKTFEYNFQQP